MGFGDILDTIFSLYRKHFLLFLGILSLHFCGILVGLSLNRLLPHFRLKDSIMTFAILPFQLVSMGSIIIATATIYLGGHITIRDALKRTGHRFLPLLVCHLSWSFVFGMSRFSISLLTTFMIDIDMESLSESLSRLYIIGLFISLPFSIYLPMDWHDTITNIIRLLPVSVYPFMKPELLQLILPTLMLPLIYFAVRWTFTAPVVLLEGSGIRSAFEKSNILTRRSWRRVLGMLISFSVLSFALGRILYISVEFILILTKLAGAVSVMDPIRWLVLGTPFDATPLFYQVTFWTRLVLGTLIFPIWVIGITLLYFDLQLRKEKSDFANREPRS